MGRRRACESSSSARSWSVPQAVWLATSAASLKVHIYSCFYAMLVTRSSVIFHRMHEQVKPNHCANQTCKTKSCTRAWHQPRAPPSEPRGAYDSQSWGGWEEEEAGKGCRVSPPHPPRSQRRVRRNGTPWAWLGSQRLSDLGKGTTGPPWGRGSFSSNTRLRKCSGQLVEQPGGRALQAGLSEPSTWRWV